MKMIKVIALVLVSLLVFVGGVHAQRKAGLTGAAFLKVGVGARATGLGSAVTALTNDVNQIFWNPAGTALKEERLQAAFSYNKWIADLEHNSAAVAYHIDNVGTIGLGFISFGIAGIDAGRETSVEQEASPTYDYRDIAVQVSFARYVLDNLSLGASVKYISQSVDDQKATAFAVDFGSVYEIGTLDWKIAARFNNLGSDLKYYDIAAGLPLSFSIGTAIAPYNDDNGKLMLAVDAVKPQDGPQYFFAGAEYSFMNMAAVRGGWKLNYSGTDDGGTSTRSAINSTIEGLSAGAGFMTTFGEYRLRLDYSYTQMDILDAAHRITLAIGMK